MGPSGIGLLRPLSGFFFHSREGFERKESHDLTSPDLW